MSGVLQKLKKLLPSDQTQQSNRKRTLIWERWDTNLFGFMNIQEIQEQLYRLLQIIPDDKISYLVAKAFSLVIDCIGGQNNLQKQHLQQRYFRLFLQKLINLITKLELFITFDQNNDNSINLENQINDRNIFQALKLTDKFNRKMQQTQIKQQISFQQFIDLCVELQQDSNDTII